MCVFMAPTIIHSHSKIYQKYLRDNRNNFANVLPFLIKYTLGVHDEMIHIVKISTVKLKYMSNLVAFFVVVNENT